MRPLRLLSTITLLGAGSVAALLFSKRRTKAPAGSTEPEIPNSFANDPSDPVQSLDDVTVLQSDELDVDAASVADQEAAQDLAALDTSMDDESDEGAIVIDPLTPVEDLAALQGGDDGDLYGGHTPPAVDREHPDDADSFDQGENWLEALSASATENGAMPELVLSDIVDDEDVNGSPHPSDTRDIPVADRGSGGTRGL